MGLSEAVLRLPHHDHHQRADLSIDASHHRHRQVLHQVFQHLFKLYAASKGFFEVSVTANALLRNNVTHRWGLFYGQDFGGSRDFHLGGHRVFEVRQVGDIAALPTDVAVEDFERVFRRAFVDSQVTIDSLVNLVYIIRRFLPNFERDRRGGPVGRLNIIPI